MLNAENRCQLVIPHGLSLFCAHRVIPAHLRFALAAGTGWKTIPLLALER